MEYSLTFGRRHPQGLRLCVLILILMEYSLTMAKKIKKNYSWCLNPYSNGILPDNILKAAILPTICLNPYSNGILPDAFSAAFTSGALVVLILILMEYSLTSLLRCSRRCILS